ncbi:DUF1149 family protein [Lactobacillus sp. DCY120]|uniref:DUF1149 family protein n=1 Tax=Bombilactobacillus apium TaxID=2675299 RepID=A0A850R1L1_9LACO|nr:DUF1149 family protein [Bombilactobacillus apium]NVY96813.1 DUF1149 family protein [Bombilactobacillus apium]
MMAIPQGPIVVQAFHYDQVDPDTPAKNEIQVQIQSYPEIDSGADSKDYFQILAPFEIHPEATNFMVSGLLGQVVQVETAANQTELAPELLQELSRPLIEQIQILTYQVTAIADDRGYDLNFTPNVK